MVCEHKACVLSVGTVCLAETLVWIFDRVLVTVKRMNLVNQQLPLLCSRRETMETKWTNGLDSESSQRFEQHEKRANKPRGWIGFKKSQNRNESTTRAESCGGEDKWIFSCNIHGAKTNTSTRTPFSDSSADMWCIKTVNCSDRSWILLGLW